MTYVGAVPGRDQDEAGLAVAAAFLGEDGRAALRADGGRPAAHETVLEASYRVWVTPWLSAQPSVQYVLQPGADRAVPDALAVALRWSASF